MKFNISGTIKLKNGERKFAKEVEAKSKNDALQTVYALFGSNNHLKRNMIKITDVKEAA